LTSTLGRSCRDQLDGRVLLEDRDEIDRYPAPPATPARAMHILDRPLRPLEPLDRGIAVESDHQPIARRARLGEHVDMTGMENVESSHW